MRRHYISVLFLLVLAITFFVYQPGLSGTYIFDDTPNIVKNPHIAVQDLTLETWRKAAFSSTSGPLRRPISMTSFAVNYYFSELDPFYFKVTNLAIHALNGIGIFILSTLLLGIYRKRFQPDLALTQIRWISLVIAAAWLLHPFNLTSVLYVVQRMTSLSALFSIWGLTLYIYGRTRLYEGKKGIVPIMASVLLFTPLATLSKENGALLPILMLVVEITLFNFQAEKKSDRHFVSILLALTVGIPTVICVAYVATHPLWLMAGYAGRDFTLSERVMTEARVLWLYGRLIVIPSITQMGLFHDDIINSRGLFQPISTFFSLAGIMAFLVLSFVIRKRAPLISFGLLFFFTGHILESTIFPFEIAHEHRNYLPMFGLLLILFYYLLYPLKYVKTLRMRQLVSIILIALFAYDTFSRANSWANPFDLALSEVEHHPNSPRDNGEMGSIYANIQAKDQEGTEKYYLLARQHFEKTIALSNDYTDGLFGLIILSSQRHKIIETYWISELMRRLEHAPFANNTGDRLHALVTCQTDGICKLGNKELDGLLQAALRNKTLVGTNRAIVLDALTIYLINIAHDYPAALIALRQAVEAAPNDLELRLNLIKFLIALQRNNEATEQLAILENLDTLHTYTTEIKLRRNLLNEQK